MGNREKFLKLVSEKPSSALGHALERIKNRERLRESQDIAIKVLTKLDELGWTQRRLAEELEVTPQQINKIVRGRENLTLETQIKLQKVLDIPILASYYENRIPPMQETMVELAYRIDKLDFYSGTLAADYQLTKELPSYQSNDEDSVYYTSA